MSQDLRNTGTADELRIVGSRGGSRRGPVRLLETTSFTIAGVAVIILIPADEILKLVGTLVIVSLALFRAVAEVRAYPDWIQLVIPAVVSLLIGAVTALSQETVINILLLLNCMRVSLTGRRLNTWVTLAASGAALVIPAMIYPDELASQAAIWIIVLPMICVPMQFRSESVTAQAGMNSKLAEVISDLLTSDDSRQSIVNSAHELSDADVAILFELDREGDLRATASWGIEVRYLNVPADETSIVGLSVVHREGVFIPFLETASFCTPPGTGDKGLKSIISFPVVLEGETIGALFAGWKTRVNRADRVNPKVVKILAGEVASTIKHSAKMNRLTESATRDPLTGLPNRRAWNRLLKTSLLESTRIGKPLSIAVLDLDHFKKFNDSFGHQAGDQLLREAAASWKRALRRDDMLFRWGGEEFTAILPNCGPGQAVEVVERLRAATPGRETSSAGVATWDGTELSEQLFERADAALYQAKAVGRDQTVAAEVSAG